MVAKDTFRKVGFTPNETEVYLLLLQIGEALASDIAKKTHISRPHVYDSVEKLIDKGLATYVIKNGRRYFRPTDPGKLAHYMEEKEEQLQQTKEEVQHIIPALQAIVPSTVQQHKIEVYDGSEGIKTVFSDVAKVGKDMLAFNTLGEEFFEYVPEYFLKRELKKRKQKRIKTKQFYVEGTKLIKYPLGEYKKLPQAFSHITLFVYGDNVAMFALTEHPLAIKIQSKEIADLYRNQFYVMWNAVK